MSTYSLQMLMTALFGLAVVTSVIRLSRRHLLSFRYTVGWITVASVGILSGLVIPLAQPIATLLGLSPAALLAIIALGVFVVISIQLSISISGLQQQIRALTEELAQLQYDIASDE